MQPIYADYSATITELKQHPSALIHDARGEIIAILNHNRPTAYLIPAGTFEVLMEMIEDHELGNIIKRRQAEKDKAITVDIDDL